MGPLIGSESGWIRLSLIIRWCVKHYWQGANVANQRNEMWHKLTGWIGVLMRLQACKMTWHGWCVNDVRGMVKAWKCMKTLGGEWNQWQACGSVWHYGFSDHWISQFCRSNNGEDIKVVCMANGWAMCEIPERHVNRPQNLLSADSRLLVAGFLGYARKILRTRPVELVSTNEDMKGIDFNGIDMACLRISRP